MYIKGIIRHVSTSSIIKWISLFIRQKKKKKKKKKEYSVDN